MRHMFSLFTDLKGQSVTQWSVLNTYVFGIMYVAYGMPYILYFIK